MQHFLTSDVEAASLQHPGTAFNKVYRIRRNSNVRYWLVGVFIVGVVILLLPWTQNIRAKGTVTTLRQEQRPQELNTIIPGRIVKWYIQEGDFVKEGDTILQLGEVKEDYFDPELLARTQQQIEAKQQSISGYRNKEGAIINQSAALSQGRVLKLESLENKIAQQELKVKSDEADLMAANNELSVYQRQIAAARVMLDSGAISLTDFEKRNVNYQNGLAKVNVSTNKLMQARQELTNLRIEQNSAIQDYADKIAKTESDRYSTISSAANTEAEVSKLKIQFSNYDSRNKLYYITAPQSGQIVNARKGGIGEMVKEGENVVTIVPSEKDYAVEMYVEQLDLPLISKGQSVRFVFDGFPVIVFSGWPEASYGTFAGKVSSIETSVSANGKFRVLVVEDPKEKRWPTQLRMGGGATGIALLKDVRIYYELWRNINGFPPDYYIPEDKPTALKK